MEATDEKGRSRWLGEGQMLSYEFCQSIRRLLAGDASDARWSERCRNQFRELRNDYRWISEDSTSLVRGPNGEIRWWTFAGGIANHTLGDALPKRYYPNANNLCIRISSVETSKAIAETINDLQGAKLQANPSEEALDKLKFSKCLPLEMAQSVFNSRASDRNAVDRTLREPMRIVSEH
ncbi:MAG: hypothetical protein IIC50_23755 [Planctomycetes bacterium]|nr:hypothetical protein [Planctomycetota bacterium]